MAYIPQKSLLMLNSNTGLTHAYGTLAQTVLGIEASFTLTASASLVTAAIRTGSIIRVGASDHEYTVASVVTTTITTVQPLTQTYLALTALKVDAVQTWVGLEGYGMAPTQASAANRPAYIPDLTNGLDVVEFTGAAKALTLATSTKTDNLFTGGGTISFVLAANDAGGSSAGRIIEKVTSGGTAVWNVVTTNAGGGFYRILFNVVTDATAGAWTTGSVVALNIPQIVTITYNSSTPATSPIIRIIGLEAPLTETSTPTGTVLDDAGGAYTIGNRAAGDRGFNGRLYEMLMYGTVIIDWNLTALEGYWGNKYSITLYDNLVKTYGARTLILTKPSTPGTYPLIIGLHGGTGTAATFAVQLDLTPLLGEESVLAFLTATKNADGSNTWNSGGAQTFNHAPDALYIYNLINYIISNFAAGYVDTDNIYIVGHSNGGMMGYRMAIEYPDLITGVFAMAADVMVSNPDTYTGRITHYHGEDDANVPLAGGVGIGGIYYTPVEETVEAFTNATISFNILPSPAEHTIASLDTALALPPYSTTFAQLIYNFVMDV